MRAWAHSWSGAALNRRRSKKKTRLSSGRVPGIDGTTRTSRDDALPGQCRFCLARYGEAPPDVREGRSETRVYGINTPSTRNMMSAAPAQKIAGLPTRALWQLNAYVQLVLHPGVSQGNNF
jgi:hypothetical protein